MTPFDKADILEKIILSLEDQLQILVESAIEAKEFSTNEESKAENKYDTRGLEASYLASGQSKRAQKLQEQIFILKKVELKSFTENEAVGVGALCQVYVNEEVEKTLFLLPVGGVEVNLGEHLIQTVTVESPVGSHLLGQKVGHEFEINKKLFELTRVN